MDGDPLELLDDARWLRRLALRLARDGAAAEDLLQELRLRAWKHAPRDAARLGPWLARVLYNLARKNRRGEERRTARERRALPADAVPTPHEVAARLDAQRSLLEEVAALEEPFRTALVLRYHDELSPQEIARRLGVPAGTVRWRIHEGLGRLRERLGHRHGGGREAWLLACAPLLARHVRGPALPGVPTVWIGVAMNTSWKLGISAAALGLLALPLWLATRAQPARSAPPAAESTPLAAAALDAPRTPDAALSRAPSVPARAAALPATSETSAAPAPPAETGTRIEGRVVDAAQRAVPAGVAELPDVPGARARCADDGRFSIALGNSFEANALLALHVRAPAHATRVLRVRAEPRATVQVGDVVLATGARVSGEVRDAEGEPAADARVVVVRAGVGSSTLNGPALEPESASTFTDEHGRFDAPDAPSGLVTVWACRRGTGAEEAERRSAWVCSDVLELAPGALRDDVELVLPGEGGFAPTAIAGVVLTPRGEPVPRAALRVHAVTADSTLQTSVSADASGRFLFDPQQPCSADLAARDPSETWRAARVTGVRGGTHDVELVLAEPRWLELAVHDPAGAAAASFEVRERNASAAGAGSASFPRTHQGEHGRLRLSVPIDRFQLEVAAPGFELARLGPFEPDSAPAELDCELVPLPGLRGRVLSGDAPVAGAKLELRAYPRASEHAEMYGFPQKVWCAVEESATSDADGRFVLTGRVAGTRVVQCLADGYALAEIGPLDVEPSRGAADLDFELRRGGAVTGVVRVAPGVSPAGIVIGANRFDGHPRTQRTDEEGRFRFEHLTAGPWRIERVRNEVDLSDGSWSVDDEREGDSPRERPNCAVAEGETTEFVLDLSEDGPARLSVHLEVDGADADGWSVDLWPAGVNSVIGELAGGRLDREGRVSFEADAGRWLARFHDLAASDFDGVAQLELELRPGETPLEAAFETAGIDGRWLDAPAGLYAQWRARTAAGYVSRTYLPLDADGRFGKDVVLAGPGELVVLRRGDGTELLRRELVLRAGERTTVELP